MRTVSMAVAAAACLAATAAAAQSGVSIYGVLDTGAQGNTNVAGEKTRRLETRHEPSYIGFRGSEDLGDGLSAVFRLESSVAIDTGTTNATTFFSRQAFVGLESKQLGTLTFGRQYDTIIDLVGVDPARFNSVSAVHGGNWDRTSGTYVNNAVKYRSPTLGGAVNFSLLYSMSENKSSSTNAGKAVGASANYIQGPLRVSAAYLKIDGASHRPLNDLGVSSLYGQTFASTGSAIVTDDTIAGVGAYYDFSNIRLLGLVTQTKAEVAATRRSEKVKAGGVGLVYNPTGIGFRPSIGFNRAELNDARWNTLYGILDYYLSRRTDVYVRVLSQKADGPARAALFLEGPASGTSQTVYGLGVTHRF